MKTSGSLFQAKICGELMSTNMVPVSLLVATLVLGLTSDDGGAVEGAVYRDVPSTLLMVALDVLEVIEAIEYFELFVHRVFNDCCRLGQDNQESTLRGKFPSFNFAV
jgi:hypothetical protein